MKRHPDLPPPPTRARALAWAVVLAGAALLLASAAHFADVVPFGANAAFLVFVAGVPALLAGLVLLARVPAGPSRLARLLADEPAVMQLVIEPLQAPAPGADVPYVARLWRPEQHRGQEPPALEVKLARDPGGVPWFVSLHDGQQARVHGATRWRGPVVIEVGDRLLLPASPRAVVLRKAKRRG